MKRRLLVTGLVLILSLVFPRCSELTAFQKNLWTGAALPLEAAPEDPRPKASWRLSNERQVEGIALWKRCQLGFPLAPITIDYQPASHAVQCRIEYDNLLLNLAFCGLMTGFLLFLRWHLRRYPSGHVNTPEDF
jgi:hypothetical protein